MEITSSSLAVSEHGVKMSNIKYDKQIVVFIQLYPQWENQIMTVQNQSQLILV